MGAITGTKAYLGELGGRTRILQVTATIAAASDTITLTEAVHGCTEIVGIVGAVVTAGADAAFNAGLQVSFSGLVITVVSFEQDGTPATDFTGTTAVITLLVK